MRGYIRLDPRYYPGGQFVIVSRNNSPENVYIQSARLDGKPLDKPWFYLRDLIDGGTLESELGPQPNHSRGGRSTDAPGQSG